MDAMMFGRDWSVATPTIQVLGLILAFLSGVVLAAVFRAIAARKASRNLPLPSAVPGRLLFGHEMKNYLCVIKGNAKLLRLGVGSKDQADIIDRIDKVVERLETFAWKESPASPDVVLPGRRESVDLMETARNCSRIHFSQAAAEFTVTTSGGLPCIQGDPHRLDQVFLNLYGNALEAGARRLTIKIRRTGAEVAVAVEDDGRGCPQDQAARIFQPFLTTKASGKAGSHGTRGLGLYIVRSIVENHGGRIRAKVKNGRGNGETGLVVYLNFPAYPPLTASVPAMRPPKVRRDNFQVASRG